MKTTNTILDLDAMLNETLDEVPEAAGYDNPPAGEYSLMLKEAAVDKYTNKDGEDCQRVKITYEVAETLSTAGDEQPVPNGTLFTETFQATQQGLGFFKKRIKEVLDVNSVEGVTLADMMNSAKGTLFNARISIKKTAKKDGSGEFWENLNIKVVHS